MKRPFVVRAAVMAAMLLPLVSGCSKKTPNNPNANTAPSVRLTNAPTSNRRIDAYYYSVTLNWVGYDPDGRVAYYQYAKDPGPKDTTWIRTEKNEETIQFLSTQSNNVTGIADDPHVFVLRAVDNQGAKSATVFRAFFSKTIAPSVQITNPRPSSQARKYVTPAIRITWEGEDIDGVLTKKPVRYKYIFLTEQSAVPLSVALVDPDSVRRYFAPRAWAGWDSTSGDVTQISRTNLIPAQEYMFVVIAFDEAGAYSPVFSRDQNMLYFRVTYAGQNYPKITFFNDFFQYTYVIGSREPTNRERYVLLELPANQPITFNWFATPSEGSDMRSYRWSVDNQNLDDETGRTDENDLAHWSTKSLNIRSATIGPYPGSTLPHRFYLEAEDINGLVSLGIIEFTSVQATFDKSLLVVKDTRLIVDGLSPGAPYCIDRPKGRWPYQSELDTFLFAVGGKPWRCYPPGTITTAGIFNGYDFDTLGTRIGKEDQTVRLSKLGHYQNIVWITDKEGAQNFQEGLSSNPKSSLRYMSEPNRLNTLGAYLKQGGKVWLVGGGALTSTVVFYDKVNNNTQLPSASQTFSFSNGELIPGRMAYDWAKWQTEMKDNAVTYQLFHDAAALGRNQNDPFYLDPAIPAMSRRTSATDPFPPNRTVNIGDFYLTSFPIEYQSTANHYYEDIDQGPGENLVDALDSLYRAKGSALPSDQTSPPQNPANSCMTIYPARALWRLPGYPSGPIVIATGFDIWSFQKTHCAALVDFVLQKLMGVSRTSSPSGSMRAERPLAPPVLAPPPRGGVPGGRGAPGSISNTRSIRTAPPPGRPPGR